MFNNLIESNSHVKEFKRRGSFLLFTTATYALLFAITGVVSIYAYDAHLESQNTELELLTFVPPPPADAAPEPPRNTIPRDSSANNQVTQSTRAGDLIDSATNPNNVPDTVGTVAPDVPPAREDSIRGLVNADPPTVGSRSGGVPGGTGNTPVVDIDPPPPPAPPTPAPARLLRVSPGVLKSQALSLPKPNYPPMAKQIRLQGTVTVQVLIDEAGNVVSAKALSGHQLFVLEAERAASQARFSPTKIGEHAVKVSGVITYNFVLP